MLDNTILVWALLFRSDNRNFLVSDSPAVIKKQQ